MQELLDHAVSSVNIIPTALLLFCVCYWIIVLVGLIDIEFFDVDVDVDYEVDVDIDASDVSADTSVSWLNSVLTFFNLGQIPLMVFLSFLALVIWLLSMATNYFFAIENFIFSLVLLIPVFIVGLFVSKILTTPFVSLFGHLSKGEVSIESYIGKICTVILVAKTNKVGQARISINDLSYLINTKTQADKVISKGEKGLVIDYDEQSKSYLIEPYNEN